MEKSLFNGIILLFTLNKDLFACGECFRFAQVSTSLRSARNDGLSFSVIVIVKVIVNVNVIVILKHRLHLWYISFN